MARTVRPSGFAGCKLAASQKLVGNSIGKSLSAAPRCRRLPRLVTPANAHGVKIAQGGDVQIGRDRDDRYDRDRRRRYYSDTTVGVGPRGVTVGPRQRCRIVTTTVERDDGRRITRKERRCD